MHQSQIPRPTELNLEKFTQFHRGRSNAFFVKESEKKVFFSRCSLFLLSLLLSLPLKSKFERPWHTNQRRFSDLRDSHREGKNNALSQDLVSFPSSCVQNGLIIMKYVPSPFFEMQKLVGKMQLEA